MPMTRKLLFLLIACVVFLSACTSEAPRGPKAAPEWSRGLQLEGTPAGGLDLAVRAHSLHLVWPEQVDDRLLVRYTRLDFPATPAETRLLDVGKAVPRYLRLLALPDGRYLLLWAARLPGSTPWGLRALLLDAQAAPAGEPFPLLPADSGVSRFDAVVAPTGDVLITWAQSNPAGIFVARYHPGDEALQVRRYLAASGEAPSLRLDSEERLHLAWRNGVEVRYASLDAGLNTLAGPLAVAQMPLGTGGSASRPVIGLETGRVYLLWSVTNRSGLEAGTGYTAYVSFPNGQPALASPTRMAISPAEEPRYRSVHTPWPALTELAAPVPAPLSSDFVLHPATLPDVAESLGVAVAVRQAYRLDAFLQIAVGVLEEGTFQGYAYVSRSQQLSDEPHLTLDSGGYWHVVWREGAFGQRVFYATNEPAARQKLDALTPADFLNALLEGGLESLTSILLMPIIGFGWLLPGLAVVGGWKLLRDDESVREWISWPALLLALALYQGAKWISLPSMAAYVPFSAWLDIPPAWQAPLQIGVPALILGVAVLVAARVARRRNPSTVLFYTVTGLVDALLTLAVYGVILLGVY